MCPVAPHDRIGLGFGSGCGVPDGAGTGARADDRDHPETGDPVTSGSRGTLPRRVLHVAPSFHPAHGYGGPIASLYALCLAQRAAGLDVRVLTSDAAGAGRRLPGLGGRWTEQFGVPTFYARRRLGEATAPELVPQLVRELGRCELVHVTALWNSTSVLALAAS